MTKSLGITEAMVLLEKGIDLKCAETGEQVIPWRNEGELFLDLVCGESIETQRFRAHQFSGNHHQNHFIELSEPRLREPGPQNDPTRDQRTAIIARIRDKELAEEQTSSIE